ncbi:tRNA (adenosine(37)-N6)-dimethylallyltransferase MiaA [Bartonella quintana]|uniref:tRNA dimethylallyltransferase n=3 Tax=Bartonella quintana TaxID=803 RepID=MIAA_BARQU|nr:tRNA (adenosine(37)-N6)-dimethylallyltransferase MiaA [Bartonella quintana]Q6FZ96.1 RecName: Full=tRNA dimethylallyltransferase; AltName: Full=Dimethylallyl diphosphate:tRNA dimethylallyltransferase; Short=DMAPP:tRNA dimethylallyltransferase; Short=DMATase; AltName: Full=Isopentenyl-diphosphate:tRNA isopentenyltransferase; Short=IPP transferase; Short=IPPT; Short=IPTase [Bartonella quintana str. Toulouse]ETS13259.1 tRNA dimethylallyltransferase [Bartonella quintana BQ2-D70]ETS14084.1 tRNA dim
MTQRTITLIAGPTVSGKSALALQMAQKKNALIINTDSMQVYDVLNILTARPTEADTAIVPHYLYGYVSPALHYSVGQWLCDVRKLLTTFTSKSLIFVGGTGLYFRALLEGLSEIPHISDAVRQKWRLRLDKEGAENLYRQLLRIDAVFAEKISSQDGQRIIRALEVYDVTGKKLSWWQKKKTPPLISPNCSEKILLIPPRQWLYERIHKRLDNMIERGALEEVFAMKKLMLSPFLPAMKAIGMPEFTAYFDGYKSFEDALEMAKTQTRRYAKRQMTWFRNQFDEEWTLISSCEEV